MHQKTEPSLLSKEHNQSYKIGLGEYGELPGLANWHTEKSFRSIRFIKAVARLI